MKLSGLYVYRAIRGGVWERANESAPWKRMTEQTGCQPTDSENFEDHRAAQPMIIVCAVSIVGVSVCAIVALG